jgi:long-chain acyl-CoA synthetase
MQLDLELYREEVLVDSDVRISYLDITPERPLQTLVLIHGFGGRARQWRYQIERFAIQNRVIVPDLRGHGRSSRPTTGYEMELMIADLTAVLDHQAVEEPFVLVGHSFGVAIATEFAAMFPDRVSRLVLIAGAGEYNIAWLYRLAFHLPEPVMSLVQPFVNGFVDASVRSLKQFYLHNMRSWKGWDKFPKLEPPTMVILGNRDRALPQEAFERVAELVPADSEVINVGVSAHMVMLERRDAVNRAIERFMERETSDTQHSRWRNRDGDGLGNLLAERPWIAHYEADVPSTIDVPALPLTRLLDRAWRRYPRRPAIRFMGAKLSYRNLSAQAGRFANALEALGAVPGTKVMLLFPNVPQLVIAYYGSLRLGCAVVMGNPMADKDEIVREAQRSGAEVLVTLTKLEETAVAVKAQSDVRHVIYANVKDYLPLYMRLWFTWRHEKVKGHRLQRRLAQTDYRWRQLLRKHPPKPPDVDVKPDDIAVVQFTSGTTAEPKGTTLTHRNIVANTLQTRAWIPDALDGQEVILCVVPFSHVYGMTTAMNVSVSLGASMVLLPTFDTREVLETIRKFKPTMFPGVPTMYVAINDFPGVRKYNIQSIKACLSGGAPLPIEVKETFEKLTKGKLVEGYGLSEAGPVTHANPINGRNKIGSIGIPIPSTEARIVDLKRGRPLPPGQVGELVVRGPQVMNGYWDDPAATAAMIDQDGWLHTNDIARMDEDGYFQIISRRQDMWQDDDARPAFPRDVEEVIYELPEVREAVVVAIANKPIVFVCLKGNSRIPAKTIIAFCQRRLPPDLVPRLVIFVNDVPRNFIGKVLRRELLSQYRQQIKADAGTVGEHLAGLAE